MDEWRRLYFQATGLAFSPEATQLAFVRSYEPGTTATFGGRAGEVQHFGSALYRVPDDLSQPRRESSYKPVFEHLSRLQPTLRSAGATEFILHFHRRSEGQCGDDLTSAEVKMLAALDCQFSHATMPEWNWPY